MVTIGNHVSEDDVLASRAACAARARVQPLTPTMRPLARLCLALLVVTFAARTRAQDQPPPPPGAAQPTEQPAAGVTPPRLSYVEGDVSYWRPGAEDWAPAPVNTPLAPGDGLYAGSGANLEVQVGPRAFVRGGSDTEIGLDNNEPDFQQFKITSGQVSLDLRQLGTGQTVEVDTPQAAFTVDRPGYYRVNVDENSTAFITRRGGTATVTPAGGEAMDVRPSEEIVLTGTDNPQMANYVAPDLDAWDRWNYDRTDHLLDAVSDRYVPQGVYGADDLDHYGNWRTVPNYGEVWVPDRVASDWAPYSTGRWIWDPAYGWTWVDDAPWGWAPYHYGRWAYVDGFWGWAPGPLLVRPAYAPALVAWFGAPGLSIGVSFGGPALGWCALGWGEPVIPWWGGGGFLGVPWWGGWGGPRIVNNEVVERNTVVNVKNITVYQNATVHHAVVAVRRDEFGRGAPKHVRLSAAQAQQMKPLEGPISERPTAASLAPAAGHARRPPERIHSRQVVATRAPKVATPVERVGGKPTAAAPAAPRIVRAPARPRPEEAQRRPPSAPGAGALERPRPPPPPHYATYRQGLPGRGRGPVPPAPAPTEAPRAAVPSERPPRTEAPRPRGEPVTPRPPTHPSAPATRSQAGRPLPPRAIASAPAPPRREHALPGEPANRLRPPAGFRPPPPPHPAQGRGGRRPAR